MYFHPQTANDRAALCAITTLILLHAVMLASLFAGVPPHPPAKLAVFGMAPFLSAVLATLSATLVLGSTQTRAGQAFCGLAMLLSLVCFGPHKAFDPAFPLIWPAVITAWIAIFSLGARLVPARRAVPAQVSA